jgi:hypothetical protein
MLICLSFFLLISLSNSLPSPPLLPIPRLLPIRYDVQLQLPTASDLDPLVPTFFGSAKIDFQLTRSLSSSSDPFDLDSSIRLTFLAQQLDQFVNVSLVQSGKEGADEWPQFQARKRPIFIFNPFFRFKWLLGLLGKWILFSKIGMAVFQLEDILSKLDDFRHKTAQTLLNLINNKINRELFHMERAFFIGMPAVFPFLAPIFSSTMHRCFSPNWVAPFKKQPQKSFQINSLILAINIFSFP